MQEPDLSAAFADVAGEFIGSAKTEVELDLLAAVAITAWNAAVRGEREAGEMISKFIDRFGCETLHVRGAVLDTRQKILELSERKRELYPDAKAIIRRLEFQDLPDGLEFEVAEHDSA